MAKACRLDGITDRNVGVTLPLSSDAIVELQGQLSEIYPVSRETIQLLAVYERLLRQWQAKTNLVAPSTLDQFWSRHIADSLQLLSLSPQTRFWCDIGSGGGLPGLVLAIVMTQRMKEDGQPANVHLVESIQKKCAFLRRVAVETGAQAQIHPIRIESSAKQLSGCEVITARALASLITLLSMTGEYLVNGRRALFHKGREYHKELEECHGQWNFDLIVHPSKVDRESVILEISNVRAV